MQKKKSILEHVKPEEQQNISEEQNVKDERQKLVVQIVKLPNGATFTKLKPVGAT